MNKTTVLHTPIKADVSTRWNSAIDDIGAMITPTLILVKTQRGLPVVAKKCHKTAKVGEALASSSQLLLCCEWSGQVD